ncbi:MAG: hypothetical protein ACLFU6_03770 [Candidatus Hydrogenedentota bacterium]
MHSEDRLIHFSTELIHAPKKHTVQALQKLYYELSQTKHAYQNTDFTRPERVRFHTARGAHTKSIALFLSDRILLAEEWTDIPLASFLEKLITVASQAMDELGIPGFAVQTVTLRGTFALSHFDNARDFMIEKVCGQRDRLQPFFQRPVAVGGMRLVFPETADMQATVNVLMESYRHSDNEVFAEVKAIFRNQPVKPENLFPLRERVRDARAFMSSRVFPYLDQFDRPEDEDG